MVVCGSAVVGELVTTRGATQFTYEESWRTDLASTPLSLSMPLAGASYTNRVVDVYLRGLLPDNEAVLERWGREFGASVASPVGLLAHVGEDIPGAMQIVRPDRLEAVLTGRDRVEWMDDEDVAALLRGVRSDQTAWHGSDGEGRWSLAGMQAKIALLHADGRWGRPYGRRPTTHILKPAIAGLNDHDLNEHLCLSAASALGLRAAFTEVVEFAGERAIVVERYDRITRGRTVTRVHQEDLCQALSVPPRRKYQAEGGPGPADIAALLRARIPRPDNETAIAAFVDALILNWIIGAPDAHAKNYSVLLAGRQIRLAPLYDVASALPYPDVYAPKVKMAMKIGSSYSIGLVARRAWQELAASVGMDPSTVVDRAIDLSRRAPDAFATAAAQPGVIGLKSPLPTRLVDIVGERAIACLGDLTA